MTYKNILVSQPEDGIGLLQLNRPKRLNALSNALFAELTNALSSFEVDDTVRVVIITGNERAFAAGADVTELQGVSLPQAIAEGAVREGQWAALKRYTKPLIAAVNGFCLGGGNELAMSCDLLIAGDNTQFGQPEINLALIPGGGGTQRLTRAVGKVVAMEMVLAGRFLSADEARSLGLVNAVVPPELTVDKALELARTIAGKAPVSVRLAKEAVDKAFELPLAEGLAWERRSFYATFATEDKEEGIAAFLEKRDPNWQGK